MGKIASCLWWRNVTLSNGNKMTVFSVHNMEHQLSGRFDSIHGEGLAILTPAWMKYVLSEKTVPRFAKFATNVFGIVEVDKMNTAKLSRISLPV